MQNGSSKQAVPFLTTLRLLLFVSSTLQWNSVDYWLSGLRHQVRRVLPIETRHGITISARAGTCP